MPTSPILPPTHPQLAVSAAMGLLEANGYPANLGVLTGTGWAQLGHFRPTSVRTWQRRQIGVSHEAQRSRVSMPWRAQTSGADTLIQQVILEGRRRAGRQLGERTRDGADGGLAGAGPRAPGVRPSGIRVVRRV